MQHKDELEKIFAAYELNDFKWINSQDIVVANWVRMKCLFGCNEKGHASCPPYLPEVAECQKIFREYTNGALFRFQFYAEKDNYPEKLSHQLTNTLHKLERNVFLLGYYKAFILNQVCCGICPECVMDIKDCKNPYKRRPSPEGFAVDVYTTARQAGFELNVVTESSQQISRFAILLIE
ncbi:DUF2284 domain-containing protein [candidate division KSB1 bacterium]|nr:DUF2284 domain-containing protein [candidate division KSB1 bacterium]